MVEILPCPFCGGKAEVVRESHIPLRTIHTRFDGDFTSAEPRINDGWLVECKKCGARGPHEYTTPIQSVEQAIAAWNRRAEPEAWVFTGWIETELSPPAVISQHVLIYPVDGSMEVAEYIGEGMYRFHDYVINGEAFTHWMPLPESPTDRQLAEEVLGC